MIEQYRRWFAYEKDVHRLTIESLLTVPEPAHSDPEFQKAVDLLAHLIAARRMWLFRFGVTTEKVDLFPKGARLADLPEQLEPMESAWESFFESIARESIARGNDAASRLDQPFEYTSYEGKRFRNTYGEILTQLFGHSWYHRGQIAQIVRRLGGTPAITDFVFWSREAVAVADLGG